MDYAYSVICKYYQKLIIATMFFFFFLLFFFFQAEDGIRDDLVTGVQTCALPIWAGWPNVTATLRTAKTLGQPARRKLAFLVGTESRRLPIRLGELASAGIHPEEIGRASCRERV